MIVTIKEIEYNDSKYSTKEWEQSVIITRWEHNHELKEYVINYNWPFNDMKKTNEDLKKAMWNLGKKRLIK